MQAVQQAANQRLKLNLLLKVALRFVQLVPVLAGVMDYSLGYNSVVADYSLVRIVESFAAHFADMIHHTAAVDDIVDTAKTDCRPHTVELHTADMVDQVEMN